MPRVLPLAMSFSAVLLVVLVTLVFYGAHSEDFTTRLACPEAELPEENGRICYRTTFTQSSHFTDCEVEVKYNRSIGPRSCFNASCSQTKAWSPRNMRNMDYQNRRICLHNIRCPDGQFMFYIVSKFQMEHAVDGICVDFMFIKNFDQPDIERCGELADGEVIYDTRGTNLEVEFRSSMNTRAQGFRIDIVCAAEDLGSQDGCTEPIDSSGSIGRRRRQEGVRQELPVAPLPLRPIVGPLGLSGPVMSAEVSVPLEAVIIYSNNVVKVVQTGRVLYTFEGMTVLYFYVTFDGVTIFRTSAPGDIFGGGRTIAICKGNHRNADELVSAEILVSTNCTGVLKIIKRSAYYSTFGIPPSLRPLPETVVLIRTLLTATVPFFADLDTDDVGAGPTLHPAPTEPSQRPGRPYPPARPGHHGKKEVESQQHSEEQRFERQTPAGSADPAAIQLAMDNLNACDPFLRAAAISYLDILHDEGLFP